MKKLIQFELRKIFSKRLTQVTLIAFNVLASFIPYWLMYGARKKTKNPMTIDQIMLKKATDLIVLNKLLYSPLELYIAALWEIAAIIPAVIKQIKRLYTGITKP